MVAAYNSASGGQRSQELDLLNIIDRFGVHAIMGRPFLYSKEIKRMIMAENVNTAYNSRKSSDNWAKWQEENSKLADILFIVEKMISEKEDK